MVNPNHQNHPFSPYGYPDPMNAPGRDALSRGYLQQEARTNYYDVTHRTTNAVPTDPGFDSDVYNFENIREVLQRNAPFLWVANLGKDNLFVIISHNGSFESSHEALIAPGEVKCYYNVWNLGLRSPTQGLPYQVTEYPIQVNCCPTLSVSVSGNVIVTSVSGDVVQISGQSVVASVSGEVVQISGQSVVTSISGDVVQISGQAVTTSISGDIVQISGQSVVTDSGSVTSVSGNIVEISGQAVTTSISGDIVITSVSGDIVQISGQAVTTSISGDIVQISGQAVTTSISGDVVITSVSGDIVITSVSGDIVQISGQAVTTSVSGDIVQISGQSVVTSVSGDIVQISGQAVTTSVSGDIVQISGQAVTTSVSGNIVSTSVSGNIVQISGQTVVTAAPTAILTGVTNPVAITGASGGVAISSGVIVGSVLKSLTTNSGDIYIGGAAPYRPFSGFGFILSQGETVSPDINNFSAVFACATVSGDKITFMGVN